MENHTMKEDVLSRLEREGITPRPRFYWLSQEYGLWAAWIASVAVGSVALAVVSFSSLYIGYSLYEATHDNLLTFLMDTLPYLWFLAFAVMAVAAYFNLRHTKKGYKYPFILMIGSSFGFSILGGMFLHYLGAGYYLDRFLGAHLESYQSRAEFETVMWQAPIAGRLIGAVEAGQVTDTIPGALFTDVDHHEWQLAINELGEREVKLLRSGKKVRLIIATSSESAPEAVVVCGVFPWLLDEAPMIAKLRDDRRQFVDNIAKRHQRPPVTLEEVKGQFKDAADRGPDPANILDPSGTSSSAISSATASGQPSACARLAVYRR